MKPVAEFRKSKHGDYPALEWESDYSAQIGDALFTADQLHASVEKAFAEGYAAAIRAGAPGNTTVRSNP